LSRILATLLLVILVFDLTFGLTPLESLLYSLCFFKSIIDDLFKIEGLPVKEDKGSLFSSKVSDLLDL
jgi:hypothetical protein